MDERTKERITCVDDRGDQLVTTSRRDHDCSCHVCHHQELEPHSVLAQLVAECCMNEIDHELAAQCSPTCNDAGPEPRSFSTLQRDAWKPWGLRRCPSDSCRRVEFGTN